MPAPKGVTRETINKTILEEGNISAAARKLGLGRQTLQRRMAVMESAGELDRPRAEANPSRWRPGTEIVAARKAEFERVRRHGDGRTPTIVHMADDGPFCVFVHGDWHVDSPGTDLALLERWIAPMNYRKHVHGFLLGDLIDNWPRVLAHLYAGSEIPAPEGWILLEHFLDICGEHLVGCVKGNHDDFSGYSDVLGMMLKKHGVTFRSHGLTLHLRTPSGREITIGARHGWPGRSIYNPAHGVMRAAKFGRREHILVGGHTHVSGEQRVKHADSGTFTHCIQVASFKLVDEYSEKLGFDDAHASPAVAAVVDPRRPDTDPQLVTLFFEPEAAVDYLASLRRKK